VVVENIFRHREMGSEPDEAAIEGTNEVALAVFSGTLTTVVVFTPLFFLPPNQMGTQFRAFGTSISFTMLASLGVAMTLVPLLAVRLIRGRMPEPGRWMAWLNRAYHALLDRILDHRWATAGIAVALFGVGGWVLSGLPRELMPEEDNRFIRMGITTPRGISVQ